MVLTRCQRYVMVHRRAELCRRSTMLRQRVNVNCRSVSLGCGRIACTTTDPRERDAPSQSAATRQRVCCSLMSRVSCPTTRTAVGCPASCCSRLGGAAGRLAQDGAPPAAAPVGGIVGMKRRLGLHGNVESATAPPRSRAHRLAAARLDHALALCTPRAGRPRWEGRARRDPSDAAASALS
jgi:hypothetical protein